MADRFDTSAGGPRPASGLPGNLGTMHHAPRPVTSVPSSSHCLDLVGLSKEQNSRDHRCGGGQLGSVDQFAHGRSPQGRMSTRHENAGDGETEGGSGVDEDTRDMRVQGSRASKCACPFPEQLPRSPPAGPVTAGSNLLQAPSALVDGRLARPFVGDYGLDGDVLHRVVECSSALPAGLLLARSASLAASPPTGQVWPRALMMGRLESTQRHRARSLTRCWIHRERTRS